MEFPVKNKILWTNPVWDNDIFKQKPFSKILRKSKQLLYAEYVFHFWGVKFY